MTSIAAFAGVLFVAGAILAASGLRRRVPLRRPRPSRPSRGWRAPPPERVALVGVTALVVLVLTRWPVAAVAAGVGVGYLSRPSPDRRRDQGAMADALTAWCEMLRDATGTPRGIEGVLTATADGAPALIRPQVTRLSRRLAYEPLDDALDGLADDLDHALGDLVVTSLRLAARSGGRQIRAVLDDLANAAREEARMLRRVEVARERPRSDMRAVVVIMVVFVALLTFLARSYLEPYDRPAGQVVLLLVFLIWTGSITVMVRMGRPRPVERFLTRGAGL